MVTSAFVGAGVVALGAAGNLPDHKAVDATVLAGLNDSSVAADAIEQRAQDNADRSARGTEAGEEISEEDVWLLPLDDYAFTDAFGVRWDKLHGGIDLKAPEGTPITAIHAGKVDKVGYDGGFGLRVIVAHPDGTQTLYAHASAAFVTEGQEVKAGDMIGKVGNTGHSTGPHLHLETTVDGQQVDPVPLLRQRGVDIKLKVEAVYGGLAAG